jgi:hypothetical protein
MENLHIWILADGRFWQDYAVEVHVIGLGFCTFLHSHKYYSILSSWVIFCARKGHKEKIFSSNCSVRCIAHDHLILILGTLSNNVYSILYLVHPLHHVVDGKYELLNLADGSFYRTMCWGPCFRFEFCTFLSLEASSQTLLWFWIKFLNYSFCKERLSTIGNLVKAECKVHPMPHDLVIL